MISICRRAPLQILFRPVVQVKHTQNQSTRLYSSNAAEVFSKHGVVPDVISVAPKDFVKISFSSGVSADGGNVLTPTQVKDPPKVNYTADSKSFHLLCMIDPDSPSRGRPTYREWHHWLVGNIPGDDVSKGEVLSDYISPCPPKGTGMHRYVFLVFKQSGRLNFDEKRLSNARSTGRELFKIQKLSDKYKMGNAITGNLFQAEWDEYVEVIYQNLSKL